MRAKLFLTILISYISIIFADSTTISGMIKTYRTNEPLPFVKIEVTRIGDSISARDTITSNSNGYYTFNYLFEIDKNKKKYNKIHIKPLNNATHCFHGNEYNYTYKGHTSTDLIGISNTSPDSILIPGTINYKPFTQIDTSLHEYKVILTQTNEDSTKIRIDTITEDINNPDYYFYINIKKYKYFKLDLSSNRWNYPTGHHYWNFWDSLFIHDINSSEVSPVNSDAVKLYGKIEIIGKHNIPIKLTAGSKEAFSIKSEGEFTHYVPRGWSGSLKIENIDNYTWVSTSPTFSNIQEDQFLNLSIKRNTNTVSGYVSIENGDSIKNAYIEFGTSEQCYATTDSTGFYSFKISHNSQFEIIPFKKGYIFEPNYLVDLTCASDITMNLTATSIEKIIINGTINNGNRKNLDGITLIFSGAGGQCVTNVNGSFSHTVRMDWSGTITPIKNDHIFEPPIMTLDDISIDTAVSFNSTEITPIVKKSMNIKKNPNFEIIVYNASGQMIRKAKNIVPAKLLKNNAAGLYFYQKTTKNRPTKINAFNKLK